MKNSADLGGCYPPRPKAEVDNTLLNCNSSYPTQPHSIIAQYTRRAEPMKTPVLITSSNDKDLIPNHWSTAPLTFILQLAVRIVYQQ